MKTRLATLAFSTLCIIAIVFSSWRKAFGEAGWCKNVPLRNPSSTLSMTTFSMLFFALFS